MIEKPLISQDDVKKFFSLAEIPDGRFDPHILRAQELDLKPVLNDALYYDFITKVDDTNDDMYADYQTLLLGGAYIYDGQTIEFPGIKPMLCSYAMARFLPANPINITRYGVVTKVNPQSAPVDPAALRLLVNQINSDGLAYQTQVTKFLSQNVATYPLYNTSGGAVRTTGVKMFRAGEGRATGRNDGAFGWYNGNFYK
jgi:hypothetical protein